MKDTKFSTFVKYFERIAAEHIEIGHTPSRKKFFRFELDEVLSGLSAQINYPALILEGYSYNFIDHRSDNPVKKRNAAFILLDHVKDPGDYNAIHQVWDKLEVIGDDIIARIRFERRKPESPIRDFNIDSVEAYLLATEYGNHYGIRYTFTIDVSYNYDMDNTRWNIPIGSE